MNDINIIRPSAAFIARELGLSTAAISYALNGKNGVSKETRKEVLKYAEKIGVRIPDRAYKPLTKTLLIGVILADLGNPFYQELGIEITQAARNNDMEVLFSHTGDTSEEVMRSVVAMINHKVDGVIITTSRDRDATISQALRLAAVPFIQVSRKMPGIKAGFVGMDDYKAATEIAEHMMQHHYRKVAIAVGPRDSTASRNRRNAFLYTLTKYSVPLNNKWNLETDLGLEGGKKAATFILNGSNSLPDAVLCGSDAMAIGMINEFKNKGIHTPDDIAVSGFDGVSMFGSTDLKLTTIIQPRKEMAKAAVNYLIHTIKNKDMEPQDIICSHKLQIGNSCGCPKKGEINHVPPK